ncbi:MAG TPA: VOC family protein [Sphingomicrobium sp.]|nr:VOC family protein [Sphingomicrobium sp.]
MSVSPIPQGYHSVTPYLVVDGAEAAIRFYEQAFGAKEKLRLPMGDKLGHAEIQIGDSMVMLADEFPEMDHKGPKSRGGPTSSILLYVEDVDSAFRQALDAGATEERAVEDQFWGDRMGTLRDPFGHRWSLATAKEEVAPDELQRRMEAMMAEGQAA